MRKLWGGAFGSGSHPLVERFGQSIESDLRFWQEDLIGSVAHARMLGACGILTEEESKQLVDGLERIHEMGPGCLPTDVEDIHTAIEVKLAEVAGPVAKKLHTARSRNDQVATDARLYLHNDLVSVLMEIKELQRVLLTLGRRHKSALMPGYTHQQPAQPITLGFHLMARFWAMQRNGWRAERLFEAANYCPLGSAALAGTGFPIDRHRTAAELGFIAPIPNALDAVSDRSFMLDALHVCAQIMIDLSSLAQELVLWSTAEFEFVRLADAVTTGSSIMPQKRNPDMAELIRGRAGRAIGNYVSLASTLKALPLAYNRDFQDDKPILFESLDIAKDSLELCALMLEGAEWNLPRMRKAAGAKFSTATDLADYLASRGIAFREAHEIVGKFVRAQETGPGASVLEGALGKEGSAAALRLLDPAASVKRRESFGGPGPGAMAAQLRQAARLHKKRGFEKPY